MRKRRKINLKKIYISMKFQKEIKNGEISFQNDIREQLLQKEGFSIQTPQKSYIEWEHIGKCQYIGPFYNEQASNGMITSTDCNAVVEQEKKAIDDCDIFVCIFDDIVSVGGISELIYAAMLKKEIIIYYTNKNKSEYNVHNEHWFGIIMAQKINPKKTVLKEIKDINFGAII